ncbi:MAG: thiaminase II [Candidatus Latescibacteria bacterium]|nr:thiaminase II [Candidatus Latescibacterota bacterium]NIM21803.1 thiaminase II [Candidatus Latescibacterota bacterium]NIM65941.1 thiaminase II [Candidatus Latescibacterota bacterium]NIO02686.1 thiaminase II [Candidatus Latescibacterota bacterium]NIO29667.1 thiaminase II [Candidatus Latescibacterota bacterium]
MLTREVLFEPSKPIWEQILNQPFVIELGAGTLPKEKFIYFIQQDYAYLIDFARALCLAGAKTFDVETLKMFVQHAVGGIEAERAFHKSAAEKLGVPIDELEQADRAPVTLAYTRHLLNVGREGTLGEIVSALLPCYWIYGEVGRRLAENPPQDELYRGWIEAYASEDYWRLVEEQLSLVDRLGPAVSKEELDRMIEHFRISSKYEFYFWDQAYNQSNWIV